MKISEIYIKNFRCIKELQTTLSDTTVLIGENNAGKTAFLDAIKLALGRRWGAKGSGFTEYDFYMDTDNGDPKTSDGITIELVFSESTEDEWPQDLKDELNTIIQTDINGIDSVLLRAQCVYNETLGDYESTWQFLNLSREPMGPGARRATNTHPFFSTTPVFSLNALRDASHEFSSRSQLWGQLLKTVNIPDEQWSQIEGELDSLNSTLISADPRLSKIKNKIEELGNSISNGAANSVDIRALPLKVWDLISRSELFVQGKTTDPWLPLNRHGQGVQSLAVIYLFQAFIENTLADTFHTEAVPILLLEEPEAHLHPQGARALSPEINKLDGQKIVTTHSPYFAEKVDFINIKILRNDGHGSYVSTIKNMFHANIPSNTCLSECVSQNANLTYDDSMQKLCAHSDISQDLYRKLLTCYTTQADRDNYHPEIKQLYEESKSFISESDILELNSWAKRIRGEILFSKTWLLCEGQTEYYLLHSIYAYLGLPLDVNAISVIDYQNNGSPGAFTSLARALGFNWVMLCDGDQGGSSHIEQIKSKNFSQETIDNYVLQLPNGYDIEVYLTKSSLRDKLVEILIDLNTGVTEQSTDEEIISAMKKNKTAYARRLSLYFDDAEPGSISVPDIFTTIKDKLAENTL